MAENIVNDSWPIIITWCNPKKSFKTQLSGLDLTPINISIYDYNTYVYLLSQLFQLFSSNIFSINQIKKNTAIKFWQSITLAIDNSHSITVTHAGLHLIWHLLVSTSHKLYFEVRNIILCCLIYDLSINYNLYFYFIYYFRLWKIFM